MPCRPPEHLGSKYFVRYRNRRTGQHLYLTSPAGYLSFNPPEPDRGFPLPRALAQAQARELPRLPGRRYRDYGRASVTKTAPVRRG